MELQISSSSENLSWFNYDTNPAKDAAVFSELGICVFRHFIPAHSVDSLTALAEKALSIGGIRRDFLMPQSDFTPRHMTIAGFGVMTNFREFELMYNNIKLFELLRLISGLQPIPAQSSADRMLISLLNHPGDTHGWHRDTPPLSLLLCLKAPSENSGGEVQFFPLNSPIINTVRLRSGDAYLLRSDMVKHQVTPISGNTSRLVLNFGYSAVDTPEKDDGSADVLLKQ